MCDNFKAVARSFDIQSIFVSESRLSRLTPLLAKREERAQEHKNLDTEWGVWRLDVAKKCQGMACVV